MRACPFPLDSGLLNPPDRFGNAVPGRAVFAPMIFLGSSVVPVGPQAQKKSTKAPRPQR